MSHAVVILKIAALCVKIICKIVWCVTERTPKYQPLPTDDGARENDLWRQVERLHYEVGQLRLHLQQQERVVNATAVTPRHVYARSRQGGQ